MSWRRDLPPPPENERPSVLLLRAIGDLQSMEGGEMITDMETVALMCGIVWVDLAALIEVGITAGYLEDENDAVGLSAKGHRWYERDLLRRE